MPDFCYPGRSAAIDWSQFASDPESHTCDLCEHHVFNRVDGRTYCRNTLSYENGNFTTNDCTCDHFAPRARHNQWASV